MSDRHCNRLVRIAGLSLTSAMDTIFIRGLRIDAVIGIHDWERRVQRPLIFDLALGLDTRAAAASDAMQDAVDYAAVAQVVRDVLAAGQPQLLETLAQRLARELFARFPIQALKLLIDKPGAIADVKGVGVEINRVRADFAAEAPAG